MRPIVAFQEGQVLPITKDSNLMNKLKPRPMIPGILSKKPIMYPELERDQIEYVCAHLLDIQKKCEGKQVSA